ALQFNDTAPDASIRRQRSRKNEPGSDTDQDEKNGRGEETTSKKAERHGNHKGDKRHRAPFNQARETGISFLMLGIVHRCAKFSRSRSMMFCHFSSTHSEFPPLYRHVKRKCLQSSMCERTNPCFDSKAFRRSYPLRRSGSAIFVKRNRPSGYI